MSEVVENIGEQQQNSAPSTEAAAQPTEATEVTKQVEAETPAQSEAKEDATTKTPDADVESAAASTEKQAESSSSSSPVVESKKTPVSADCLYIIMLLLMFVI